MLAQRTVARCTLTRWHGRRSISVPKEAPDARKLFRAAQQSWSLGRPLPQCRAKAEPACFLRGLGLQWPFNADGGLCHGPCEKRDTWLLDVFVVGHDQHHAFLCRSLVSEPCTGHGRHGHYMKASSRLPTRKQKRPQLYVHDPKFSESAARLSRLHSTES